MSDAAQVEDRTRTTPHIEDIEARARKQGWRPQEEYTGHAEWVDAQEFMRRGEESTPILRQKFKALEDRYQRTENELREVKTVLHDFREFSSRAEQRAYERALKDLQDKQRVAVAHADTEAYEATQREINELQKTPPKVVEAPKPPQTQHPQVDPRVLEWVNDNPWYNADRELGSYARSHDQFLMDTRPGMDMGERLAAVKAKTMTEFPEKFGNQRRAMPSTVSTPASDPVVRNNNKRTYENLPPDAKKQCDKTIAAMKGGKTPYTREDWVSMYDWSE